MHEPLLMLFAQGFIAFATVIANGIDSMQSKASSPTLQPTPSPSVDEEKAVSSPTADTSQPATANTDSASATPRQRRFG